MEQDFIRIFDGIRDRYGYRYQEENGVGIYSLPALSAVSGFSHGFSARTGGISKGSLASLNLSFTRPGEKRETVMENYRIFCRAAGIDPDSMVMDTYEHGTTVRRVDHTDRGRGWTREPLPPCDGLITDDPYVTLVTGHADCMPFFLLDPVRRASGMVHAGWRGALGRIGFRTVQRMREEFGTAPEDLVAGVGPSISQTHFEVSSDVADAFREAFPDIPCIAPGKPGKSHVDLWMVAAKQFMEAGIRPEHIHIMGVCTYEDLKLYSHRREHGDTGGMAAYLRINGYSGVR